MELDEEIAEISPEKENMKNFATNYLKLDYIPKRAQRYVMMVLLSILPVLLVALVINPLHLIPGYGGDAEFWQFPVSLHRDDFESQLSGMADVKNIVDGDPAILLAIRDSGWMRARTFEVSPLSSTLCHGEDRKGGRVCKVHQLCYDTEKNSFFIFFDPNPNEPSHIPLTIKSMIDWNSVHPDSFDGGKVTYVEGLTVMVKGSNGLELPSFITNEMMSVWQWLRMLSPLGPDDASFSIDNHMIILSDEPSPMDKYFEGLYTNKPVLYLGDLRKMVKDAGLPPVICFRDVIIGSNTFIGGESNARLVASQLMAHFGIKPWDPSLVPHESPIAILAGKKHSRITNEIDLIRKLHSDYGKPVYLLDPTASTLQEIISIISQCGNLVTTLGDHGRYSIFLPPGATVLEIFPNPLTPHMTSDAHKVASLAGMDLFYTHWTNPDPSRCSYVDENGNEIQLASFPSPLSFLHLIADDKNKFEQYKKQDQEVDISAISDIILNDNTA